MGIILGYVLLLLLVIIPITQTINSLIGGGIGYLLGGNHPLGMLLGNLIIWGFIDFLWIKIFQTHIPILALSLCIIWLFIETYRTKEQLNRPAKIMIASEQWALVILGIYVVSSANNIHWI